MTMVLQVKNLESWYGESHILHGVNFSVRDGEVVGMGQRERGPRGAERGKASRRAAVERRIASKKKQGAKKKTRRFSGDE